MYLYVTNKRRFVQLLGRCLLLGFRGGTGPPGTGGTGAAPLTELLWAVPWKACGCDGAWASGAGSQRWELRPNTCVSATSQKSWVEVNGLLRGTCFASWRQSQALIPDVCGRRPASRRLVGAERTRAPVSFPPFDLSGSRRILYLLERFQPPRPSTHKRHRLSGRETRVRPDRAGKWGAGAGPAVQLLSPAGPCLP